MEDSMLYHNHYSNGCFVNAPKRKASLDLNHLAAIKVNHSNEKHCLGCSFYSETGAVLKRTCWSKPSGLNGSFGVLSRQKVCSDGQCDVEGKAHGLERVGITEDSSAQSKTQNEEELNKTFKSFLAIEIRRQVLDGLGATGHSHVQDLQVIEIEDIVDSVVVATSNERNETTSEKPYLVKVKLLATVCIPISLQSTPRRSCEGQSQKLSDAQEVVGEKKAESDSLPLVSSQEPVEHPGSHTDLMEEQITHEKGCYQWGFSDAEKKTDEVSWLQYESSFGRAPLAASNRSVDDDSHGIFKRKDRIDSVCPLVMNDFEVYDFDSDKSEDKFVEGQFWALYDDKDGMPRHYAQITEVHSRRPFQVSITLLEPKRTRASEELMWLTSETSSDCCAYELQKQQYPIKLTHLHHFSHPMKSQVGSNGEILIIPSKGEVWALYKDGVLSPYSSPKRIDGKYELVHVVDRDTESLTLTVVPLLKIAGFRTRFVQEQWPFNIAPRDFFLFSHRIPAYMVKEVPRAYLELDPVSTPKLNS